MRRIRFLILATLIVSAIFLYGCYDYTDCKTKEKNTTYNLFAINPDNSVERIGIYYGAETKPLDNHEKTVIKGILTDNMQKIEVKEQIVGDGFSFTISNEDYCLIGVDNTFYWAFDGCVYKIDKETELIKNFFCTERFLSAEFSNKSNCLLIGNQNEIYISKREFFCYDDPYEFYPNYITYENETKDYSRTINVSDALIIAANELNDPVYHDYSVYYEKYAQVYYVYVKESSLSMHESAVVRMDNYGNMLSIGYY